MSETNPDKGCTQCTCNIENESKVIPVTDSIGREIFWEDLGRPND